MINSFFFVGKKGNTRKDRERVSNPTPECRQLTYHENYLHIKRIASLLAS